MVVVLMWGAFRPEDPLPWGEGRKGGFLWGRRLRGRPLTPTLSRGEREEELPRNGGWRGPGVGGRGRAALTPALSLKGDLCVTRGTVARKTPHPNPLPEEREQERRHCRWTPSTVAHAAPGTDRPLPGGVVQRSLKGEGERRVSWAQGGPAAEAGPGCEERLERKTLTPTLSHGEREKDAPLACQHGCSPAEGAGRRWFISGEGSRAA